MAETTEEDVEVFKQAFIDYQLFFQLNDYSAFIHRAALEDAAAAIQIDANGRSASVAICEEYPDCMQEEGHIEKWARHEAIHLLLADHNAILQDPASSDELKARSEEALVLKIEHILDNLE